ncbi:hypothetical protein AC1031_020605 [Aphanomyces cochlioides]|nr:hypothetical protein AC1031_020605 [Aphanomyces cochlioides]
MTELSIVFINQNKLEEALDWSLRCFTIPKRVLGEDHPETSRMQNNVGIIYLMLGKTSSARQANLGNTFRLVGNFAESERILLDCLQKIQSDALAKAVCRFRP